MPRSIDQAPQNQHDNETTTIIPVGAPHVDQDKYRETPMHEVTDKLEVPAGPTPVLHERAHFRENTDGFQPITPPTPEVTADDKKKSPWIRRSIAAIAGAALFTGGAVAFGAFKSADEPHRAMNGGDTESSAPAVPGQSVESHMSSPEFIAHQQEVDKALSYLNNGNMENRAAFETELDNISNVRGANYFKDRGLNTTATVDMSVKDANDWVLLNIFKAWNAARSGDINKAQIVADAVAEGQELSEVITGFNDFTKPNVSALYVREDIAPVYEVVDSGSIRAPSGVISINQPGTKLYAYTANDPNTNDFMQVVLRFTPSSQGKEGAWSEVVTEKPGVITAADVHQNKQ